MKHVYQLFLDELEFYRTSSEFTHVEARNISGTGTLIEMAIRKLLREVIGKRYHVTHGYIYSSLNKKLSPQIDIIITDTLIVHSFKTFGYLDGMEVVPAEAVVGIFEIKRKLTKKSINEAITHLTNIFNFVPLKKDNAERYLPGGIQLISNGAVQFKGGQVSNPIIGIIGLELMAPSRIDKIELPWFINCLFGFDGYFKAYSSSDLKSYQTFSLRSLYEPLIYLVNDKDRNKTMTSELILQGFIGYLIKYLSEVCGRNFDMNNYFPGAITT